MLSFLIPRDEQILTSSGDPNKRAHGFEEVFSVCCAGFVKQVAHLPLETRHAIGGLHAVDMFGNQVISLLELIVDGEVRCQRFNNH